LVELVPEKSLLLQREQYWIDLLGASGPSGLNICAKAGSRLGVKVSQESRLKMRNARLGRRATPEENAKRSASLMGRLCSDETRERISKKAKARAIAPKTTAVLAVAAKREEQTLERIKRFESVRDESLPLLEICRLAGIGSSTYLRWVKAGRIKPIRSDWIARAEKISRARKGYVTPDTTKALLSAINTGKTISEETKRKISAAHAAAIAQPGYVDPRIGRVMPREAVERATAKRIGQKRTDEQKARMSVAAKKRVARALLTKAGNAEVPTPSS
jgi:hypothetical protein